MSLSRKDFLALASLAAAGLFIPGCTTTPSGYTIKEGAGLLIDPNDVDRLREVFANEPLFAKLRMRLAGVAADATSGTVQDTRMGVSKTDEILSRDMARDFLRNKVRLNDQLYDIVIVGDIIEDMSFQYLMTGDEDAAELAVEALDTLMRFEKWDYFLEGGTQTIGFQRAPSSTKATVLGIQWLGDKVSEEKRREYLTTMATQGLEPCYWATYGMRYKDQVKGWSFDERLELIRDCVAAYPWANKVEIDTFTGLLVNHAQKKGVHTLVRGVRQLSDFEYEFRMALMNRRLGGDIETIFLMPREELTFVSATLVREVAYWGGDLSSFVPEKVAEALRDKFRQTKG